MRALSFSALPGAAARPVADACLSLQGVRMSLRRLARALLAFTVVGTVSAVGPTSVAETPIQIQAVPAPPPGFSTVWSDDFDGAAGTGLDTGIWRYDVGPGSSFGTGE